MRKKKKKKKLAVFSSLSIYSRDVQLGKCSWTDTSYWINSSQVKSSQVKWIRSVDALY